MSSPPLRGSPRRFVVLVCDSVGCGQAPDAAAFGDAGASTLAHVIEAACPALPELRRLGLDRIPGVPLEPGGPAAGAWGRMVERSPAKDTMTGHWELMGLVTERRLPTYPEGFPAEVMEAFEAAIGRRTLGNRAASGTGIVDELGAEHMESGAPIVYTSADSVFQVAAHEAVVPVEELYEICRAARRILTGRHGVGRVIARPFVGEPASGFARTPRRKDLALPPPGPTALDRLVETGFRTHGVGKIHDIFAGRGLSTHVKTVDNADGMRATREAVTAGDATLVLTNLVDFDSSYGHRRDPRGYARALEAFDAELPALERLLRPGDVLVVTADHGNDPTHPGSDHTRECVPLLVSGPGVEAVDLGTRSTFADLAATILDLLSVPWEGPGTSFGKEAFQPVS